jgi:hypothetical protein
VLTPEEMVVTELTFIARKELESGKDVSQVYKILEGQMSIS